MVYQRPPYLVRLPSTVKELLLDMQTKAKQLQWSIMGSQNDVTLTLTWQCKQKKLGKREKRPKAKQKTPDNLSLSDWVSDTESTQYQRFSKQLEIVQMISKLASAMSKKPIAGNFLGDMSEMVHSAVSPQDTDDGYLTEKATPDEMHVYPKVVVRPPFYLPSTETLINGDENDNATDTKSNPVQVPVPLPPPPAPPVPNKPPKFTLCNTIKSKSLNLDKDDTSYKTNSETNLSDVETFQNYFEPSFSGDAALHDILETNTEDEESQLERRDGHTWEMSKSSIDPSTEDGNTSCDRLLTPGSDYTDNEIGSAIRFGKYVKFQDSDSEIFHGSGRFYDWDLGESDHVGTDLDEVIPLQDLDNSPRHKLSYIEPDSVENLNKKKKVKRRNSFQKLFAPLQRKQKHDKKKPPKSPKLGRKLISPKPLYLRKNYISTSSSVPGSEDTSYNKVIAYQRIKTGTNRQGGDAHSETWDSSLDSHLQLSVDHCLQSCDSILSRQAHAPSDL
ncbi:uncharacterized protein LOC135485368 [Lineus longissimus]|uniref:uncharacterized protein LOC135485368 n=1 Tax=Lineus longissimus TaxID=88925 RepID=UPI002B4D99D7